MPLPSATQPFSLPAGEVVAQFGTDPTVGLSADEVAERRRLHGENVLRHRQPRRLVAILLHQFQSIIVWLLAGAAVLSFLVQGTEEGVAILVVLAINGLIGFVTELRAARSMEALERIGTTLARVRRGGRVAMVDASELVPGDIVLLEAGDVLSADMRLLAASRLQCDEAILTGESLPAEKAVDPVAGDAALGDRVCMVYKGTSVTRGTGEAVVTGIGMETEIGHISSLLLTAEPEATPLERQLDRLGARLVHLMLGLAAVTIIAGVLRGYPIAEMIETGVALAVAAIPEGLPVVATLSLARGMWRMAARNALIVRLSSVETLGATTLILTDKTGTLTENRMTVTRYLLAGGDVEIPPDGPVEAEPGLGLGLALRLGATCNTADAGGGDPGAGTGDPMDLALLSVAARAGAVEGNGERTADHAFDPENRMMAVVHAGPEGYLYAIKGAPESVIACCDGLLADDGVQALDATGREAWLDRNRQAASGGLRCLALAMKRSDAPDDPPYRGLTLVGLVAFADPLRGEVPAAIAACRRAGIRVVMITGDHAATAARIAHDAGICDTAPDVIEGHEIAGFDPRNASPEVAAAIETVDVFARIAPDTKLALVSFYQDRGQVVAMTGDGVNDAPALAKADIGVAMGQRGTQVAREAAAMVLKNDSFATIVVAIRQGRVIFDNIRKFVLYLMSCNLSEVLVVGLAVLVGLPSPLLPLQILFLNLVTDVFPAFALGLGQGDGAVMERRPREPRAPILGRRDWIAIFVLGGAITVATLAAYILALSWLGLDPARAVTVAFVTLSLAQLWNVFNMRSPETGILTSDVLRNPYVWSALAICLGLVSAALWVPGLSDLLRLPSPGATGLGLALGLSLAPLFIGQLTFRTNGAKGE